jgi:hypothetical protein
MQADASGPGHFIEVRREARCVADGDLDFAWRWHRRRRRGPAAGCHQQCTARVPARGRLGGHRRNEAHGHRRDARHDVDEPVRRLATQRVGRGEAAPVRALGIDSAEVGNDGRVADGLDAEVVAGNSVMVIRDFCRLTLLRSRVMRAPQQCRMAVHLADFRRSRHWLRAARCP